MLVVVAVGGGETVGGVEAAAAREGEGGLLALAVGAGELEGEGEAEVLAEATGEAESRPEAVVEGVVVAL